jgi:hypothetical protein
VTPKIIELDSKEFTEMIQRSTALRGQRHFAEAIGVIVEHLPELSTDCLLNAYLAIIQAAEEGGVSYIEAARECARRRREIDPNIPAVRKILATGSA